MCFCLGKTSIEIRKMEVNNSNHAIVVIKKLKLKTISKVKTMTKLGLRQFSLLVEGCSNCLDKSSKLYKNGLNPKRKTGRFLFPPFRMLLPYKITTSTSNFRIQIYKYFKCALAFFFFGQVLTKFNKSEKPALQLTKSILKNLS